MTPNPQMMRAIEALNYRVTAGDVVAQTGLQIAEAQQGLLNLAADASGHLQVAESGEMVFLFPPNFRAVLRQKFFRLQLQEWWQRIWKILFYAIRISFGIILILSILLMLVAIFAILIALSSQQSNNNDDRRGGGFNLNIGSFWIWSDLINLLIPDPDLGRGRRAPKEANEMNFLEAMFSFLFGDGNPNADLEDRRWQQIGAVIQNHQGAVIAQQIAPYLDQLPGETDEDYMIPVLARFNGYPAVSPEGELVYYFPDLQVAAKARQKQSIASYLQEQQWRFSRAGSGQIMGAIVLGGVNIILALMLGSLLKTPGVAEISGLIGFVSAVYPVLVAYGTGFLAIPIGRYFWLQGYNQRVERRNQTRQDRTQPLLQPSGDLVNKLNFAQQFAKTQVIGTEDLAYRTDEDLLDQNLNQATNITQDWEKRLGTPD